MSITMLLIIILSRPGLLCAMSLMAYNVRRYVALAQSRGGTRFCTRDRGQKVSIQTAAASRITGS